VAAPNEAERPAPPELSPETLARVKKAVVLVRVTRTGGVSDDGSGFLASDTGVVVTSASLLGMRDTLALPPQRAEVVFNSGTASQRSMTARVLSVDREDDVACLQIAVAGLPTPLAIGPALRLVDGQRLYVAGFPGTQHPANLGLAVVPTLKVRPNNTVGRIL